MAEKITSDFRRQTDDGQPRGVGTGGLAKAVDDGRPRGVGSGGLEAPTTADRGAGTGGLAKPIADPGRGVGSGGLAAKIEAVNAILTPPAVAVEQPAPVNRQPPLLRSLVVAPGAKAALRAQLAGAIVGVGNVVLAIFDALITESGAPAAAPEPGPETVRPGLVSGRAPWELAGFGVSFDDVGGAVVGSVVGDSPAGRAGLQPLDRIVGLEDNGAPWSVADMLRGWNKGLKWGAHRVVVDRGGASAIELSIPKS
jgi:hypothetical protein